MEASTETTAPVLPGVMDEVRKAGAVMIAYADEHGGLLAVEYPGEPLNADLGAAIMGNLIKDVLGDEPDLRDVVSMQRTLVATLQGGESDGKRTAG